MIKDLYLYWISSNPVVIYLLLLFFIGLFTWQFAICEITEDMITYMLYFDNIILKLNFSNFLILQINASVKV